MIVANFMHEESWSTRDKFIIEKVLELLHFAGSCKTSVGMLFIL